ncbi:hypothetical protein Rcae01_06738 [Novipirellula caenicola]|uniref:Uncharacterized protein n=1 Tax=Novipirellula caenicola TaxID=1536901 RepID=A0ABP9W500_9BACT
MTGSRTLPRSRVRVASYFEQMTPTHQTSDLHGFFRRQKNSAMKGILLVLLDRGTTELDRALDDALAPHRLDEDAKSWPRFYWDYWHLTSNPFGGFAPDTHDIEPVANCNRHACIVGVLPVDYNPSAIITPDGLWNDLSEFGWRLIDEPSAANTAAMAKWQQRVAKLRQISSDCIGVEVLYHC